MFESCFILACGFDFCLTSAWVGLWRELEVWEAKSVIASLALQGVAISKARF